MCDNRGQAGQTVTVSSQSVTPTKAPSRESVTSSQHIQWKLKKNRRIDPVTWVVTKRLIEIAGGGIFFPLSFFPVSLHLPGIHILSQILQ